MKKGLYIFFYSILALAIIGASSNLLAALCGGGPVFSRLAWSQNIYAPFGIFKWPAVIDFAQLKNGLTYLNAVRLLMYTALTLNTLAFVKSLIAPGKKRPELGKSRFLKPSEVLKLGFSRQHFGVVMAQLGAKISEKRDKGGNVRYSYKKPGQLLLHNENTHMLIIGATRGGKGVNNIIPTLISWTDSIFAFDPKGELFLLTAEYRRRFSYIIKFSPTEDVSHRWNPLDEIDFIEGEPDIGQVQNIAAILVAGSKGKENDFWTLSARRIVTMGILWLLTENDGTFKVSFNGLIAWLHQADFQDKLADYAEACTYPILKGELNSFASQPENTFENMTATLDADLAVYLDRNVSRNTDTSDFSIKDLQLAGHPVTLYFIVSPKDAERIKPLQKMFLSFINNKLSFDRRRKNYNLLLLLDEFPNMGYLDFIEKQIAICAGYGIKMMLVIQNLGQIYDTYSKESALLGNTEVKIFLGATKEDSQYIADLCGKTTIENVSYSESGKSPAGLFDLADSKSKSISSMETYLIRPEEVEMLSFLKVIIKINRQQPIMADKVLYYLDNRFAPRTNDANLKQGFIIGLDDTKENLRAEAAALTKPADRSLAPTPLLEEMPAVSREEEESAEAWPNEEYPEEPAAPAGDDELSNIIATTEEDIF
jgi:type IV secretory pathway TraG/TraD family ATPase VirD4